MKARRNLCQIQSSNAKGFQNFTQAVPINVPLIPPTRTYFLARFIQHPVNRGPKTTTSVISVGSGYPNG